MFRDDEAGHGISGVQRELFPLPVLKSNPIFGVAIDKIVFPFAHGNDNNQQAIVANLIDQAISCIAKFDLVAIGQAAQPGRFNARSGKTFSQPFLEELSDALIELAPFLEGGFFELKFIVHQATP